MGYVPVRGITIHSIPYKEKDKILVIFTDKLGKIKAKIRSVRSASSKRSGLGDEFLYETILLYRKSGYYTITDVKLNSAFLNAKLNFSAYILFAYIRELVVLLTMYEQSDMKLFNLILDTLQYADKGYPAVKTLTVYFILHFLRISGNPLNILDRKFSSLYFSPERDGFNLTEGASVDGSYMETVRYLYSVDLEDLKEVSNANGLLALLNNFIYYHTESKHFLNFVEMIHKLDNI